MKKLLLSAAALALMASGAMAQQVVRIASEGAYPPYNFINDATGELDGFERALGDELCRRANLTCEWVINDWDSIIPNLVAGNYDAIMAGMSITEARAEIISFTQNYILPENSAYLALEGTAMDVITSGVISAQSNTIQAGYIADSTATLVEFATPDETIAAVRNGEVDAVFADQSYLEPFQAESGGQLVFLGDPIPLGGGVGMGLRQSDVALREAFDAAIASMKADGSLNALLTEWFGEDQPLYE
jgi:polar amino acid transport system substrate-binding protein